MYCDMSQMLMKTVNLDRYYNTFFLKLILCEVNNGYSF